MAEHKLPGNVRLIGGWADNTDGWGDNMNQNLRVLSALCQGAFEDFLPALPGNPGANGVWILKNASVENSNSEALDSNSAAIDFAFPEDSNSGDDWFGGDYTNAIAVYDNGTWFLIPARQGMILFTGSTGTWFMFNGANNWVPCDVSDGMPYIIAVSKPGTVSDNDVLALHSFVGTVFFDTKDNPWGDPGTINGLLASVKNPNYGVTTYGGYEPQASARVQDDTPLVIGIFETLGDVQIGTIRIFEDSNSSGAFSFTFDYFPEDSNSSYFAVAENQVRQLSSGESIYFKVISGGGGTWADISFSIRGRTFS